MIKILNKLTCIKSYAFLPLNKLGIIKRMMHLPTNPTAKYKAIQAVVIKDRNPIGKFKARHDSRGIITVFIGLDGLLNNNYINYWYRKEELDDELRKAFISHLDEKVCYLIKLTVRKWKLNVDVTKEDNITITKEDLKKDLESFITWAKEQLNIHFNHEENKYRDRAFKTDYAKFIFKPVAPLNNNYLNNNKDNEDKFTNVNVRRDNSNNKSSGWVIPNTNFISKRSYHSVSLNKYINYKVNLPKVNLRQISGGRDSTIQDNSAMDLAEIKQDVQRSSVGKWNHTLSPVHLRIMDIIKDEKTDIQDKQIQIENINRDSWYQNMRNLISNKKSLSLDKISFNILVNQIKNLDEDLNILFNKPSFINKKSYMEKIKNLESTIILSIVMSKVIPFAVKYADYEEQPITKFIINLGMQINRESAYEIYSKEIKSGNISKDVKLNEYIEKNNLMLSEEELAKLGLDLVSFFCERSTFIELKEILVKKNLYKRILLPKDNLNSLLEIFGVVETAELPMLVKPLPWEINRNGKIVNYGGSYLNRKYQYKQLVTSTHKNYLTNKIKLNQDVIDVINTMSGYSFKVNNKLFDIITSREFLKKDGGKVIDFNIHPETSELGEYIKNKNRDKVGEILSHNSNYLYNTSILNIAFMMRDMSEIFTTATMDWRGRFYFSSCVLNIQGGELARALLLFSKGDILNDQGLKVLKIYAANAYGLDKKSKIKRLEWTEQHLKEILDIPNNDLWLSADEPLIFLACALELQGYYQNPDKFISSLPILLDGTCNGLQHLSAIANDINLAEKVNICASSDEDEPNDVYSELVEPIKEEITKLVNSNPEHYNLSKLNITRKLIKRGIMTITYGVTVQGILDQLLTEFFVKPNLIDGHYVYKPKNISLGDITLSKKEIYKLSEIIYNILFKMHNILEDIMLYFHSIVKLLNKLPLHVSWITPSGLELHQSYTKFTRVDVISIIQSKRRKISLRKVEVNENNEPKINTVKQVNSFVPNFIHSMDASNIVLLIKEVNLKYHFDVVTIHDCFGVHANFVDTLSHLVKETFISIYGDKDSLNRFHAHILSNIKAAFPGDVVYDKSAKEWYILKKDEKLRLPNKPKIGKMELKKQLINSNYFIN